jgi:small conductance mechanosensitive channel
MEFKQTLEPVTGKLQGWAESLMALLPNLVVAIAIVVFAWGLASLSRRATERLARRAAARNAVARLLGTVTALVVIGVGLFVALGVLELDKTVTSLLAGAGVLGLAIGFAAQNLTANFLSGTVISLRRPYREGDLIETSDHFGTVERIELRVTRLRTTTGQIVLIPNKDILESPLVNYSELGRRRVDVSVGVSYGDDLERVKQVAIRAIEALDGRHEESEVELFYEEFGASSINFALRFWIPFECQVDYKRAQSEAIMRIKKAFDEHDISIPFPIRTLDFGSRGGTALTEAVQTRAAGQAA